MTNSKAEEDKRKDLFGGIGRRETPANLVICIAPHMLLNLRVIILSERKDIIVNVVY